MLRLTVLLAIASAGPIGIPEAQATGFLPTLQTELLGVVLRTETGATLAKALLGPKVTRFNPNAGQEVLHVLSNPENRELAEAVEARLTRLVLERRDLQHLNHQLPPADLLKLETELLSRRIPELFTLSSIAPGEITFANDSHSIAFRNAYEARKATFLMGGAPAPVLKPGRLELPPPPQGFQPDAFEQFLQWEEQASIVHYRETSQFFGLEMGEVKASEVEFEFSADLPRELRELFVRGSRAMWPKHPYNTHTAVPFLQAPIAETWPARFTASRSLVIWNRRTGQAFSLKAPTNYPHRIEVQAAKASTKDDIASAIHRSDYILRMDQRLGPDHQIKILRELLTGAEKSSQEGFVVRDLSPLQDGNYYFPAFSIPYAGEAIAKLNGRSLAEFWGEAYASQLGKAKARLLIRYGLQMETPNTQNMLIQLDRRMRPTGVIVFRDMSDTVTTRPILEAMGESGILAADEAKNLKPLERLNPMTQNSFWRLNEHKTLGIPNDTLVQWRRKHDTAYINEILRLTGVDPSSSFGVNLRMIEDVQHWLFSPEGLAGIRRFHQR